MQDRVRHSPALSLDDAVELLEPDNAPSLRIVRRPMPLRQAIAAVLAKSPDGRSRCGIALHEPAVVAIGGKPALRGYLAGVVVAELWGSRMTSDKIARAVFAPMGDDAHLSIATIAEGSLSDVLAAAQEQPGAMHLDIYIYVDLESLTALPLDEALAWAAGTGIN